MRKIMKFALSVALASSMSLGGIAMAQNTINQDTELSAIIDRLANKETPSYVTSLDKRMQSLVTIATLSALGDTELLKDAIAKAIEEGVATVEIRETLYQGMAYVGTSLINRAEITFMQTLEEMNLPTELEKAGTVNDENRFDKGFEAQTSIFGYDHITQMHQNTREDSKHLNVDLLTGFCFGDSYTREVLPLKEREFLTFVYIAALGGCEPQVKAHAGGNIAVGNTRQMLLDALTVMVPYIGFPKTLNAQAMVNEVTLQK